MGANMTREWADDPGTRRTVAVRCAAEPMPINKWVRPLDITGCGWTGGAIAVTQYGATELRPEECPECGGQIEVSDD